MYVWVYTIWTGHSSGPSNRWWIYDCHCIIVNQYDRDVCMRLCVCLFIECSNHLYVNRFVILFTTCFAYRYTIHIYIFFDRWLYILRHTKVIWSQASRHHRHQHHHRHKHNNENDTHTNPRLRTTSKVKEREEVSCYSPNIFLSRTMDSLIFRLLLLLLLSGINIGWTKHLIDLHGVIFY